MARSNLFIALGIVLVVVLIILKVWAVIYCKLDDLKAQKEARLRFYWVGNNKIEGRGKKNGKI